MVQRCKMKEVTSIIVRRTTHWGTIRNIKGLYRDNGKENGNPMYRVSGLGSMSYSAVH